MRHGASDVRETVARVTCDRCGTIEEATSQFEVERIRIFSWYFIDPTNAKIKDLCIGCAGEVQDALQVALARRERDQAG